MVHELITDRKSIRAFSDQLIDDDSMIKLFEAARWAPSSRNEQPWRFIVTRKGDKESFERMVSCLNESNKNWAQHCAALVLVLTKTRFSDPDVPNTHALFDTGLAVANLSFQATFMNIYLHQMGGFHAARAAELFTVPAGFEPVIIIAMGYQGNPESLPEPLRASETMHRRRKPLDELVYSNQFGEKSTLLH